MIDDNRMTVKNGEGKRTRYPGLQYTDIPDYNITARYSSNSQAWTDIHN